MSLEICKLEVTGATCQGELGVVVGSVRMLRGFLATGEDWSNTEEDQACKVIVKVFKPRPLVKGLIQIVGAGLAGVAGLVDT